MKTKRLVTSLTAFALLFSLTLTPCVFADNLGDKKFVSKKSSECQAQKPHERESISLKLLAKLTSKTVDELETQYPQQTAWQIAKTLGKLDDLKKAYLENSKKSIDGLVEDKKIEKDVGDQMYADIEKRINAIDGVTIVVPGRPSYRPYFNDKNSSSSQKSA